MVTPYRHFRPSVGECRPGKEVDPTAAASRRAAPAWLTVWKRSCASLGQSLGGKPVTHALYIIAYTLAVCVLSFFLNQFAGLDLFIAILSSMLASLLVMQIEGAAAHTRTRRIFRRQIGELRQANAAMRSQLEEARSGWADVAAVLTQKSDAQERKVVGELQMIEGLIREFASNIAEKARHESRDGAV